MEQYYLTSYRITLDFSYCIILIWWYSIITCQLMCDYNYLLFIAVIVIVKSHNSIYDSSDDDIFLYRPINCNTLMIFTDNETGKLNFYRMPILFHMIMIVAIILTNLIQRPWRFFRQKKQLQRYWKQLPLLKWLLDIPINVAKPSSLLMPLVYCLLW